MIQDFQHQNGIIWLRVLKIYPGCCVENSLYGTGRVKKGDQYGSQWVTRNKVLIVTWPRQLAVEVLKKMSGFWIHLEGRADLIFYCDSPRSHTSLLSSFNPLPRCNHLRAFPKHSIWNSLLMPYRSPSYPAFFYLIVLPTWNYITYEFVDLLFVPPNKMLFSWGHRFVFVLTISTKPWPIVDTHILLNE